MSMICEHCNGVKDIVGRCNCGAWISPRFAERPKAQPIGKDTQIAQLTAENKRLQRVVEQSTKGMSVDEYGDVWIDTGIGQWMQVGSESKTPDLYAQLKGVDRG